MRDNILISLKEDDTSGKVPFIEGDESAISELDAEEENCQIDDQYQQQIGFVDE